MAYAYILKIGHAEFGAKLQRIREILMPASKSEAHITVRYPIHRLAKNDLTIYEDLVVNRLGIVGPSFFVREENGQRLFTIYLRCESDELETWSYKPDFPDSVFHVTLYDGPSLEKASWLLDHLNAFEWRRYYNFRPTKLTAIPIPVTRRRRPAAESGFDFRLAKSYLGNQELPFAFEVASELQQLIREVNDLGVSGGDDQVGGAISLRESRTIQKQLTLPTLQANDAPSNSLRAGHLTKLEKKKVGYFLTPPEIAVSVAAQLLRYSQCASIIDFGDPAVGSGSLFAAFRYACQEAGLKVASAVGVELEESRAELTASRWGGTGLRVYCGDFLEHELPGEPNVVLANPPYSEPSSLDAVSRKRVRGLAMENLGIKVSGQSRAYVYFVLRSHFWLSDGGVAAWLLPYSFLDSPAAAPLRQYLVRHVRLLRIHLFGSRSQSFEDADVPLVALFLKKEKCADDSSVDITVGPVLSSPISSYQTSNGRLRRSDVWMLENSDTERRSSGVPLGNIANVCRGVATGNRKLFVVSRSRSEELELEREYLVPILEKSTQIDSEYGYKVVSAVERLPLLIQGVQDLISDSSNTMRYLDSVKEDAVRSFLVRRRSPWYKQERRVAAHVFFPVLFRTEEEQVLPFIWSETPVIATNNFIMISPNGVEDDAAAFREGSWRILQQLRMISVRELRAVAKVGVDGFFRINPGSLSRLKLKRESIVGADSE